MAAVHRIDENLEHEVESDLIEELQAQGELMEVVNGSSSAADVGILGKQLLQLDLKKDDSTSYRVYQRRQRTGKGTGGNLVCTVTIHLNFCRVFAFITGDICVTTIFFCKMEQFFKSWSLLLVFAFPCDFSGSVGMTWLLLYLLLIPL